MQHLRSRGASSKSMGRTYTITSTWHQRSMEMRCLRPWFPWKEKTWGTAGSCECWARFSIDFFSRSITISTLGRRGHITAINAAKRFDSTRRFRFTRRMCIRNESKSNSNSKIRRPHIVRVRSGNTHLITFVLMFVWHLGCCFVCHSIYLNYINKANLSVYSYPA